MRQFAGKAFHFLSDRIFHATEVLPGERAVRQVKLFVTPIRRVSSTFYSAFLFQIIDKIGQASFVFSCLFCQILLADSGFLP